MILKVSCKAYLFCLLQARQVVLASVASQEQTPRNFKQRA